VDWPDRPWSRLQRMERVTALKGEIPWRIQELISLKRELRFHEDRLAEVDETPKAPADSPALPDSHLNQPMPSVRWGRRGKDSTE